MRTTALLDSPHRRANLRLAWLAPFAGALWACDSNEAPMEPALQAVPTADALAAYEVVRLGSLGGGYGEARGNRWGTSVTSRWTYQAITLIITISPASSTT